MGAIQRAISCKNDYKNSIHYPISYSQSYTCIENCQSEFHINEVPKQFANLRLSHFSEIQ